VVTYDLFFGTLEIPPLAAESLTDTQYQPKRRLKALRTYYWKIVAKDNTGLETEGAIWQFTTGFLPEIPEECMIELALGKDDPRLSVLRRFRDEILHKTEEGRRLTQYYYRLTPRLLKLIQHDQEFKKASIKLFEDLYPSIEKSLRSGKFILSPALFLRIQNLLDRFVMTASRNQ
jgi:hypothetical protein